MAPHWRVVRPTRRSSGAATGGASYCLRPSAKLPRWADARGLLLSRSPVRQRRYTMKHTLLLAALLLTFSAPVFAATLCPDGQYHADGICKLCPDGSYTTAPRCALSPDGKYIPDYGRGSKLTPDGKYIPDTGSMVLCPDGNYYPGRSCRLLPDGRYIGVQ